MEGENGPGSIPTAHIVTPFLLKAAEIILAMEASRIIKSLPDFSKFFPLSAYFPASFGAGAELLKAASNYLQISRHAKVQALQNLQNADY